MRWTGHVGSVVDRRDAYRCLVRRPDGKRPLGRPRLRWEIILKFIFKEWNGDAWTGLLWLRIGAGDGRFFIR